MKVLDATYLVFLPVSCFPSEWSEMVTCPFHGYFEYKLSQCSKMPGHCLAHRKASSHQPLLFITKSLIHWETVWGLHSVAATAQPLLSGFLLKVCSIICHVSDRHSLSHSPSWFSLLFLFTVPKSLQICHHGLFFPQQDVMFWECYSLFSIVIKHSNSM